MTTQDMVNETWNYCIQLYGIDRLCALTLHGSQNYELDLPESDIDTKLFICPTWREVIEYSQPLSKTINGPYGDINVTDIRLFIGNNLVKQNFNFLECLFTPYSCVNSDYADLWSQLMEKREWIAHMYPSAAVRTMMGQVENQYGRWGRFDKKKTLYHMMRITGAIETYLNGQPFADTLIPLNRDHIMKVRLGQVSEEDMDFLFKHFYDYAHWLQDNRAYIYASHPEVIADLRELQADFVYRSLYELRCEE